MGRITIKSSKIPDSLVFKASPVNKVFSPSSPAALPGFDKETLNSLKQESYQKGYRDALLLLAQEREKLWDPLARSIQELPLILSKEINGWEPRVIRLALAIAQEILVKEVEQGRYNLAGILDKLIQRLREKPGCTDITVFFNPSDYDVIQKTEKTCDGVKISSDPSIPKGGCQIQSSIGNLWFTIEEQMDEIKRIIAEELNDNSQ